MGIATGRLSRKGTYRVHLPDLNHDESTFFRPGRPLISSVRSPLEVMLSPDSLRPNAEYYIGKVIVPPLNRCFSLVGADAMQWSVRSTVQ